MAQTTTEQLLATLYDHFAHGRFPEVLAMCTDDITFKVPGATSFSGVHTKATFMQWIGAVWELSGGTFREVPYDLIGNDSHGVVLLDHYVTRNGSERHYRVCHIWQVRDGKFCGWEEWPGDEAAFNAAWS